MHPSCLPALPDRALIEDEPHKRAFGPGFLLSYLVGIWERLFWILFRAGPLSDGAKVMSLTGILGIQTGFFVRVATLHRGAEALFRS